MYIIMMVQRQKQTQMTSIRVSDKLRAKLGKSHAKGWKRVVFLISLQIRMNEKRLVRNG
jgi:hypothetical protein